MYLLDTNVLSHLVRRHPPVHLTDRLRRYDASALFTSCVCVMELRSGAIRRDDGGVLWSRIEREILSRVAILDVRTEEALVAGDVLAHLWSRGRLIDSRHEQPGPLPTYPTAASRGLDGALIS